MGSKLGRGLRRCGHFIEALKLQQPARAVEEFERALAIDSELAEAWSTLAAAPERRTGPGQETSGMVTGLSPRAARAVSHAS
jgi:hypothetical protein